MITEIATIIGKTSEQTCPTCHGSGLDWRNSHNGGAAAFRCRTCPQDMTRPDDSVGTGKILLAAEYTVDDMLAWLRAMVGSANVTVGLQSDEYGFPDHLPPGFWVGVEIGSGSTSYTSPTLHAALEYAVMGTHADLTRAGSLP